MEYGIGGLISRAVGKWVLFTDGGNEKRKQYIHKVTLSNLLAEETYCKCIISVTYLINLKYFINNFFFFFFKIREIKTISNVLVYHCGSDLGWSNVYYFKTLPTSSTWSPHFAVFGDLGNVNAQSLPRLQEETQKGLYDAILHVGDFAYDMDSVCNFYEIVYRIQLLR